MSPNKCNQIFFFRKTKIESLNIDMKVYIILFIDTYKLLIIVWRTTD